MDPRGLGYLLTHTPSALRLSPTLHLGGPPGFPPGFSPPPPPPPPPPPLFIPPPPPPPAARKLFGTVPLPLLGTGDLRRMVLSTTVNCVLRLVNSFNVPT
ncbi:hypothetical protein PCASD_22045 [Puccinia coronata f. sp. avenae]|uniref:Uncharacterized protein n=1 Tax=Puccinia coronata f. sp. avenae TaxID=200324 RepID=A0A2N5TK29_9BASI|nr:hypothetical protein PCASD_22045 [Puccinia coronata f. sp. avenae]